MPVSAEIQVICNRCHWQGRESQLKESYSVNPHEETDVCPACLTSDRLEYKPKELTINEQESKCTLS